MRLQHQITINDHCTITLCGSLLSALIYWGIRLKTDPNITSSQTGVLCAWCKTGRLYSRLLKLHRTSLVPYRPSVTSVEWDVCTEPKDTKRKHPQPQTVQPAAIWQQTQKYLLPYHQTTEQLLYPGYVTPEHILNTPPSIVYFFDSNIISKWGCIVFCVCSCNSGNYNKNVITQSCIAYSPLIL